jgi:hypothetical protein
MEFRRSRSPSLTPFSGLVDVCPCGEDGVGEWKILWFVGVGQLKESEGVATAFRTPKLETTRLLPRLF